MPVMPQPKQAEKHVEIEAQDKSNILAAKELIEDFEKSKKATDTAIQHIKDPKKRMAYMQKSSAIRAESSGIVDSLTRKFVEYATQVKGFLDRNNPFGSDDTMGFLMLAPFAIKGALIIAAGAVLYAAATYAGALKKEKDLQEQILNDPTLSTIEKAKMVASITGEKTGKIAAIVTPIALVLALGIGAKFYFDRKQP